MDANQIILDCYIDIDNSFPYRERPYYKVEYYKDAGWVRYYFNTDRTVLKDNIKKVTDILSKHKVKYDIDSGWAWRPRTYKNYTFNNPDRTYNLFILPGEFKEQEIDVSDTTDELYDCDLFSLRAQMVKQNEYNCKYQLNNFSRTLYGFETTFYTKKDAIEFYKSNPYNKVMEIVEGDSFGKKVYIGKIYMDDKIPEIIMPFNIKSPRKKMISNTIAKKSSNALVESALAKLTKEEKEALGLLYYNEF